jgi:hypothetical protein
VARTLVDLTRLWLDLVVRKQHLAATPATGSRRGERA